MSRGSRVEAGVNDIGLITPEIQAAYPEALDFLVRQGKAADQLVALDSKLSRLTQVLGKEAVQIVDHELADRYDTLKHIMTVTDMKGDEAVQRGMQDLRQMAVVQAESVLPVEERTVETDTEHPIFFSGDDQNKAKNARSTESLPVSWRKRLGIRLKKQVRQPFEEVAQRQEQLVAHHKERKENRSRAAEIIKEKVDFTKFADLETYLQHLENILKMAEKSTATLADKYATGLQRVRAKQCLGAIKVYFLTPAEERADVELAQKWKELEQALDLERLTQQAKSRMETMLLDLEGQMAKANVKVQGIARVAETLPLSRADVNAILEARAKVDKVAAMVSETYTEVTGIVAGVLEKLQKAETEPEVVEGLITTIQNGNLNELYLTSFNKAMKELRLSIEAFGKLLNLRSVQELPTHDTKATLSAHSDAFMQEGELVTGDSEVNLEALREVGLVKKELRAFPEANRLIREIVDKKIDPTTKDGQERLCKEWPADCPPPFVPPEGKWWHKFYPETVYPEAFDRDDRKKGNFWYVQQLRAGNIVANLEGDKQLFIPDYNAKTVFVPGRPDEDWDATDGKDKKLQTAAYNDKLLNSLLEVAHRDQRVGCVNISREIIDGLLWLGDPGERIPSAMQVQVLKHLVGNNWNQWEIRCANEREIEGKHNLWTHLDGYFLEGEGRHGLLGGRRRYGGASGVDGISRGGSYAFWAVRLVLSRKH